MLAGAASAHELGNGGQRLNYDLIIVGGGPAGTAAAITAARLLRVVKGDQARVLLLERGTFPRQKVCGEFVSAEALDGLRVLLSPNLDLLDRAPRISSARLFVDGEGVVMPVAPPAASIPRWELDHALWNAAISAGAECRMRVEVTQVEQYDHCFRVSTTAGTFDGRSIIDASGRWSKLKNEGSERNRGLQPTTKWIGLKAHFATTDIHPGATDLYFFDGGYCGVQPVGEGRLNVCAMVRVDYASHLADVLALHPSLHARSVGWSRLTDAVAVAPLVFHPLRPEREGVLCAGDAAGFIDPFVGDGISLALRSGILAARSLFHYWGGTTTLSAAIAQYRSAYKHRFAKAFRTAAWARAVLSNSGPARWLALRALRFSGVAEYFVRSTR